MVDGDRELILKDTRKDATLARAKNLLHGAPSPERKPTTKPEEHDDIAHYRRELGGFFDELIETRRRLTTLVDPTQYEARMQRIKSENVTITKQVDELQKELASAREEIAQLYVELEAGEVSIKGVSSMIPTHSKAYDKPVRFTNSVLAKLNKLPEADASVVVSAITALAEKGYSATMSSQQHKKQVASKPLPPSVNRSRASAEWRFLWSQEADGLHVYDIGRRGDRIGGRNEREG
jgi:chromosome segregation ATPase